VQEPNLGTPRGCRPWDSAASFGAAYTTQTWRVPMHEAPPLHVDRYIPFKREGWGAALFVCLLAMAIAASAFYVHQRTFKEPTDVRMGAAGNETRSN
jgi:hypothetical protein